MNLSDRRSIQRRFPRTNHGADWLPQPAWRRTALAAGAALILTACPKPPELVPGFAAAVQNPFGLAAVAAPAAPAFADIDDDGDLDLFAGAGGEGVSGIGFLENVGTGGMPSFAAITDYPDLQPIGGGFNQGPSPAFGSLYGIGQNDLLVGHSIGNYLSWEVFEDEGASFASTTVPADLTSDTETALAAGLADLDGDGLVDALVSTSEMPASVVVNSMSFHKNTGTSTVPVFTDQTTDLGLRIPSGSYAFPTFVDIDLDGDFDAFVGDEYGDIWFFANTGTSTAPEFTAAVSLPFGIEALPVGRTVPTFADIDGDGDEDLFVGDVNGDFWYFENTMF